MAFQVYLETKSSVALSGEVYWGSRSDPWAGRFPSAKVPSVGGHQLSLVQVSFLLYQDAQSSIHNCRALSPPVPREALSTTQLLLGVGKGGIGDFRTIFFFYLFSASFNDMK